MMRWNCLLLTWARMSVVGFGLVALVVTDVRCGAAQYSGNSAADGFVAGAGASGGWDV